MLSNSFSRLLSSTRKLNSLLPNIPKRKMLITKLIKPQLKTLCDIANQSESVGRKSQIDRFIEHT